MDMKPWWSTDMSDDEEPAKLSKRFFALPEDVQDEILAGALEDLADDEEEVAETLLRAVYYEEPYAEIALSMGLASKGTVTKRKDRGLALLRQYIEQRVFEYNFAPCSEKSRLRLYQVESCSSSHRVGVYKLLGPSKRKT